MVGFRHVFFTSISWIVGYFSTAWPCVIASQIYFFAAIFGPINAAAAMNFIPAHVLLRTPFTHAIGAGVFIAHGWLTISVI